MEPPRLERSIGTTAATAMVVGTIVGASIFVQPAVITARVPSPAGIAAAWLAAGILTLLGSLVCAELASALPRSGGVYVYLSEAFGPATGFLWGWAMFWSMHSGIVAAIAVVFGRYVGHLMPLSPAGTRLVAVAGILALTAVNYAGVRQGSRLQTGLTALKVAAVGALVLALFGLGGRAGPGDSGPVTGAVEPSAFLLAVGAGLFAYGGWHMVTYAAEETIDPARTIPRALLVGTLVVTACYVALNAAYLHALPLAAVMTSRSVAADAARAVVGPAGEAVVAAIVVVSTLGALNGIILAGPRVYYAMARDGLLFRWAGRVHPSHHTPDRAIALQALWSSVLVATGTYEALFSRVIYTEWLFFAAMALGLLVLRRRPGWAPRYRMWGSPATPALFAAAAIAVAVNQIASRPLDSALGLALVATGLPVYLLWRRFSAAPRTEP